VAVPIAWNDDPPESLRQIEANIAALLSRMRAEAERRDAPTVDMAREWHRDIYRGVSLPVAYYAGEVRDSDARYPELIGYEVQVGQRLGMPSADVPAALNEFQASMQAATRSLDAAIPVRVLPNTTRVLVGIVQLSSQAHGEWIRIHPFANGNGRTARLWVAWIAARYRLPLFLQLKPRPEATTYAVAAAASMQGDHRPMELYLGDALARALAAL